MRSALLRSSKEGYSMRPTSFSCLWRWGQDHPTIDHTQQDRNDHLYHRIKIISQKNRNRFIDLPFPLRCVDPNNSIIINKHPHSITKPPHCITFTFTFTELGRCAYPQWLTGVDKHSGLYCVLHHACTRPLIENMLKDDSSDHIDFISHLCRPVDMVFATLNSSLIFTIQGFMHCTLC